MPPNWVDLASGGGILSGVGACRHWTVREKRPRVKSFVIRLNSFPRLLRNGIDKLLFSILETRYDFPDCANAELAMQSHYESLGYRVLNNTYGVIYRSTKTKYTDAQAWVDKLFPESRLDAIDRFARCVFPGDGVTGVNPGHPDLLVFREDCSDAFFCEVKTKNDRLAAGQMVGISLIHAFLGSRIEIARVNGMPRSYRWAWPAVLPLHAEKEICLSSS